MVFSSIEFLSFFMPVVLALYVALPPRARNALLVVVSLVFYAWGAHAAVSAVPREHRRELRCSSAHRAGTGARRVRGTRPRCLSPWGLNLGCLMFWKYAVFGVHQVASLSGAAGLGSVGSAHIMLPLGISFFTFHGISYLVDIYRGRRADAERHRFRPVHGVLPAAHRGADRPLPRDRRAVPSRRAIAAARRLAEGFPRFRSGSARRS